MNRKKYQKGNNRLENMWRGRDIIMFRYNYQRIISSILAITMFCELCNIIQK